MTTADSTQMRDREQFTAEKIRSLPSEMLDMRQEFGLTTTMLNYIIAQQWEEHSSKAVIDGLLTFNKPFLGIDKPRHLSIIARSDQDGIVGGVLGETKWDWMYIGWLWVSETHRAQGVGTRLMRDAEQEAVAMGCHHAHLTTLDFQARVFYEKLGYEVFAALEDYPRGHTRFMMKKKLG
jgi:GNAT superfamily N-acetyltransferase